MTLTYPEIVTRNANQQRYLLQCVRNGHNRVIGANAIIFPDGRLVMITDANKATLTIYEGCKVERHLRDGDLIILNRNPTLHKKSIMAGFAKIMHNDDKVVRVNPLLCKAYNMDFDGDEPNLHVPQSEEARAEMMSLMLVDHQIVNASNGGTIIAPVQDPVLATYIATRMDSFFERETIMNMLMEVKAPFGNVWKLSQPAILKPVALWTGKQVLSMLVPSNIFFTKKVRNLDETDPFDYNERYVQFHEGELLTGALDGPTLQTLIHYIWRRHGGSKCLAFMSDHQRYMNRWFKGRGFSVGIDDCKASTKTEERLAKVFDYTAQKIARLQDETQRLGMSLQSAEPAIAKSLRNVVNMAGKVVMSEMDDHNSFYCQAVSKSKGNTVNISQIIGANGQQNVGGQRILPTSKSVRNFSHFYWNDANPTAYGLVTNNIFRGVSPTEFYLMVMAGREGLVDTAVKTSETGYIQRRLGYSQQANGANHDGTVRNGKQEIIGASYGSDGCDGIYMESCTLDFVKMSDEQIASHYSLDSASDLTKEHPLAASEEMNFYLQDEIQSIKTMRTTIRDYKYSLISVKVDEQVNLPVNIRKYIQSWCFDARQQAALKSMNKADYTLDMVRSIRSKVHECCVKLQTLSRGQPCSYMIASIKSELTLKTIMIKHRMCIKVLDSVLFRITDEYARARVDAGEMIGSIAAHSIGEPTMQMTLNVSHGRSHGHM